MILKMLHCKQNCGKKKHKIKKETSSEEVEGVRVKIEDTSEEICRVCLKDGQIRFTGETAEDGLLEELKTFADIDVDENDPHPKYLCQTCHTLLQGAVLFRKTAQKSDKILKNQQIEEPPSEIEDQASDYSYSEELNNLELNTEQRKVKSPRPLTCKKCDMTFQTFQEYDDHRLSAEHENKRMTCTICKKTYAPMYYRKHMVLHTQASAYMCDVCGKNFIVQSHLTRHRLTHFYDLPFKCSLCPYKGRFRESLKMHMRSHTGERPYQCDQCPSRFINKSNLNKHALTHKGEHDFRCEVCGRGFYTKRELELHFKVDHTGIKDHVCRVCGKTFGYRKQMMKHELKVHKREKLKSGRMPIYLKVETMKQQGVDINMET